MHRTTKASTLGLNEWFDEIRLICGKVSLVCDGLPTIQERITNIEERLGKIEESITQLHKMMLDQRKIKEAYTPTDLAEMFGKAKYTVREWCRLGRIRATKTAACRGGEQEWRISHEELMRYQREGLLPMPRFSTRP